MLCLITTHYPPTAAILPAPLYDCPSAKTLLCPSHSELIWRGCGPFAEALHTAHPPQQPIDTDPTITCWLLGLACSLPNTWKDYQEDRAELPYWSQEKRQQSQTKARHFSTRYKEKKNSAWEQSSIGYSRDWAISILKGFSNNNLIKPWATCPEVSFEPALSWRFDQVTSQGSYKPQFV